MGRSNRLLIFFGYAAFVAVATLIPTPDAAVVAIPGLDKVVHVCLFGGLGGLGAWSAPDKYLEVAVGGMGFGLATELGQTLVPTRSFDLLDLAADAAGVLLGILVWQVGVRWRRRRGNPGP